MNEAGEDVEVCEGGNPSVYGTALLLLGLFHIIEWFRTILLLMVTCMKYEFVMYI